jgi:hypothetical protein
MTAQEHWRLEESEVELVASSQFHSETVVSVISILCNWSPPISGRCDPDFLDIWVAADESLNPKSIAVYGCEAMFEGSGYSHWRDTGVFVRSKTAEIGGRAVGLYHFSGSPIDEFVVRLTDHRGEHHYDNNGGYGVNYHLRRYHGFQLTCVRAAIQLSTIHQDHRNWILVFPRLVEIRGSDGIAQVSLEE